MYRLVVTVVVAALAMAACGQSRPPVERLSAASAETSAADTASFSMDMVTEIDEGDAGMDMTVTGDGVIDFANDMARMEMNMPGLGGTLETVVDGDTVYTLLPGMFTGGEDQWIRQESSGTPEMGMGASAGLGDDPADMVEALDDVDGEITELGEDEVRGADVRGYGFTVTGTDLVDDPDTPESLGGIEIPTEAWLDTDDRLRRMVTEMDVGELMEAVTEELPEQEGPSAEFGGMMQALSGTMTMTVEFFGFGEAVDIAVPDDAEVIDAGEFEQQMMDGMPGMEGLDEMPGMEGLEDLEGWEDLEDLDPEALEELREQLPQG